MSENEKMNKALMEENQQHQELDSVLPATSPSREQSHEDNNIVLDYSTAVCVEKEKRPMAALLDENSNDFMRSNKQIVLDSVKQDGWTLKYASETLKGDKDIVMTAVKQYGYALRHASETLRGDREIVLAAVKQNGRTLEYASETLKGNKEIVMAAVQQYGCALRHASETSLQVDRDIVLAAVTQNGRTLEYASETFRSDKEIVMAAVQQYGCALRHASETLRGDREIVLAAVKQIGLALGCASETLKGNKEFVTDAVKQNGLALEYASDTLKADKEIVLAAVKQYWRALQYASEALKGDKDLVMNAVKTNGLALKYASNSLRSDKEVVLAAVRNHCDALKYTNDALKRDRDCLIAAGIWDENYPAASIDSPIGMDGQQHFILSTKYSLGVYSNSIVTEFTRLLNKNRYIRDNNVKIFSPNAFCKSTCDPKWTRMSWPCRGTYESCKFADHLKTGKPHDGCCWRYSFRWHLEEAKKSNGIMIQVVDEYFLRGQHFLGDGQKIEKLMAEEIGIKVFQFYQPSGWYFKLPDFRVQYVDIFVSKIQSWYDDGCKDMTPCGVKFEEE